MHREIKKTGDGSATLFVPELKEHYHSINGAVQESQHVFIERGLNQIKSEQINILEIGFGTGLNALLTLLRQNTSTRVEYHSLENSPLDWAMIEKMEYPEFLNLSEKEAENFQLMHTGAWNEMLVISEQFKLKKINEVIQEYISPEQFNLVYYDAFAPDVQPEMWEEEIFKKLFTMMKSESILVTYCAKGEVRRRLQRSGLSTERLPGPPGKWEMLRATKQ